jgi:glycosyltransferase involved in cell wall biosynthesis
MFTLGFSGVVTLILVFFAARLQRAFRWYALPSLPPAATKKPSVSVCIPARNETHAMAQCLERVLASDYEKLEILVLDDSSDDDTSYIIRSFAHAGVRFVPGKPLPDGWLGKNHTLDVLANEASGTYTLFLDVDTFIGPSTISKMVDILQAGTLDMLSVIPVRDDTRRLSVLFGTLRYFWRLVFATKRQPASSCAAWMIDREVLLGKLGGFAPCKGDVQPEASIAAKVGAQRYRCVVGAPELEVAYEKRWSSQLETSRRLLYPLSGGTWWRGMAAAAVLVVLNMPVFVLLSAPFVGWTVLHAMALWLLLAFMAMYATYAARAWRGNWWLGGLLWPVVIFQELVIFIQSIGGYARHTITWKGRPITAAVLQADHLEIDQ